MERRAAFANEEYWGRPVPGFGDPAARLLVVGLAPAAHGANRTGRMFTGDRSGDWLFRALHRAGFADRPVSLARDDGLRLADAYVTAALRCAPPANRPTAAELANCRAWLEEEHRLLARVQVVACLGAVAYGAVLRLLAGEGVGTPHPRPRFAHGLEVETDGPVLVCSYHPSQQNTFTGRLTEAMLDSVLDEARAAAGL
ncbi:MAG: Uracil-DNA glycosylase superfamily [Acidobacteria bacterium]|nr:Uracil-DNA glycosylase superfamily [Acidobacteriota bacterium]